MATGYRPPHQLPHEVDEQPNLNPPLITKLHHHQNSIQPLARSYAELLQNKNPSSSKAQPFKPFSIDRATLIKGNFQTKSQFVFGDFDSKYSSPLKPIVDYCGKKAILFQKSDKDRLLSRIQLVLLGKFSHGRPPIYAIKDFFCSLKLKGSYNISLFDYKHLYIECELLEDYIRIWLEKVWIVKGFHMRIFKWCADFKPRNESPIAPIWVHLNGLPLYLFEKEALWSIANVIGNPLLISKDNLNRSNLSCASFCVELDVTKQFLDEIWIEFGKEIIDTKVHSEDRRDGFWQKVEYGYIPKYCTFCAHIDHSLESCKQRYLKCPSESNRRMEEKFIDLAHGSSTATLEQTGVQGFQVLVDNGKVAGKELPVGETAVPGIPAEYKETAAHTLTEKSSGSKDQGIEGCRFANNQQTLDAELQQTHEQDRGVQPNMHSDALAKPAMDSAIGESPDAADSVTKIMAAGINAASTRLETNGTAAESVLQYDVSVSAAAAGRGLKNKGVVAELDTGAVAAESAPDPAVFSAPVQNSIDVHEHFGNLECAEFGQNEGEIGGEDNVLLHNQGQKSAAASTGSQKFQAVHEHAVGVTAAGQPTAVKAATGQCLDTGGSKAGSHKGQVGQEMEKEEGEIVEELGLLHGGTNVNANKQYWADWGEEEQVLQPMKDPNAIQELEATQEEEEEEGKEEEEEEKEEEEEEENEVQLKIISPMSLSEVEILAKKEIEKNWTTTNSVTQALNSRLPGIPNPYIHDKEGNVVHVSEIIEKSARVSELSEKLSEIRKSDEALMGENGLATLVANGAYDQMVRWYTIEILKTFREIRQARMDKRKKERQKP